MWDAVDAVEGGEERKSYWDDVRLFYDSMVHYRLDRLEYNSQRRAPLARDE